jgi:hypoxanthine phosphoribosyltransferase
MGPQETTEYRYTPQLHEALRARGKQLGEIATGMTCEAPPREVILDREQLGQAAERVAQDIYNDYRSKEVTLINTLFGAIWWTSLVSMEIGILNDRAAKDGCPEDTVSTSYDSIEAHSYGMGGTNRKEARIEKRPSSPIYFDVEGNKRSKNIIIMEDILDSGQTLDYMMKYLQSQGADTDAVKICALVDKPESRDPAYRRVQPDYCGVQIYDPRWIIGWAGFDIDGLGREMPDGYFLKDIDGGNVLKLEH